MSHKTTTCHSDNNNEFVGKVVEFPKFYQIFLPNDEIIIIDKKSGEVSHTTGSTET